MPEKRRAAAVAVVVVLVALASIARPLLARETTSMDPEAFASEVRRISAAIAESPPESWPAIPLPAAWVVEVRGERVDVPATWLHRALQQAANHPSTAAAVGSSLRRQLEAIALEADGFRARVSIADDGARVSLESVLARPEFRGMANASAIDRLRQRFTEWLQWIWQTIGGDRIAVGTTARVFGWIVVVLALSVIAAWLLRTLRDATRTARVIDQSSISNRVSARAWARQALTASDVRDTARCAYRAAVCVLEEEGAWRVDESRTPREYLRLLSSAHDRRPVVADVVGRFEEICYGGRRATRDDRDALIGRLEELGCLPAD